MISRWFFAAAALAAASTALPQSARRPDAADPAAPVPALRYESAFTGYKRLTDDKPAEWRRANDEAGRLGGHAGHVPGSVPPRPAAPSAAPAATTPQQGERK